jgi:predicted RNase H-like nuclease (RuvC/YqgF family)
MPKEPTDELDSKKPPTLQRMQRTVDELRREIESQRLRIEAQADRINFLRAEVEEIDDDYQRQCARISAMGQAFDATLEDVRKALQRNPPNIAGALELIAKELD